LKVAIRDTGQGLLFPVKVAAGSRRQGIRGVVDGVLKISVTVAPEKGKANKAVIRLLAKKLQVPASALQIAAGGTTPQKQICVQGLTAGDLQSRLQVLTNQTG
jgi:uncharacterized protein (TIGR00251 family)